MNSYSDHAEDEFVIKSADNSSDFISDYKPTPLHLSKYTCMVFICIKDTLLEYNSPPPSLST